jgi:hypothetical protein
LFSLLLFTLTVNEGISQEVEHNYKVGPQITTCDSLVLKGSTAADLIEVIKSSKFRFDQTFRLTRKQGLKSGAFYSCDNQKGFLVIEYNEQTSLYKNIDRTSWEAFIRSSDPEGYYLQNRNLWTAIP